MNLIAIIKYLPYIFKIISIISSHLKNMESENDRKEFITKVGDAFEKSKSGDTSNIEQLLNGK